MPIILLSRENCKYVQPIAPKRVEGDICSLIKMEREKKNKRKKQQKKQARQSSLCKDIVGKYLEKIKSNNKKLPRRGGKLNKAAIAKACGISRNAIYTNQVVSNMLESQAKDEETPFIDPVLKLSSYLLKLKESAGLLLRSKSGVPNKLKIAKDCGFNRRLFYNNDQLNAVLKDYSEFEKITRQQNVSVVEKLQCYLSGLRDKGEMLPRRKKGMPNKTSIAGASGICVSNFYENAEVIEVLSSYATSELQISRAK